MTADKSNCAKCGVKILQATADRTGGLCMPCKNETPKRPDPKKPAKVSCIINSGIESNITIVTSAQNLLEVLDETRHIGDSKHANKYELEAQRALLRHAIRYRTEMRLHDDHWGRTKWALLKLFDQGEAEFECGDARYRISDISKEDWREGDKPLMSHGGILYRNSSGDVVYKTISWIS